MKAYGLLFSAFFIVGSLARADVDIEPAPTKQIHKLESPEGKIIEAEIIAVTDRDVRIRRGRKDFTVLLTKFSAKTQAHIKKWGKENISYSFAVKRAPKQLSAGGGRATYGYLVTLESRVGQTLEDITVKYQIYNTIDEMRKGQKKISLILTRDDVAFETIAGSRTKDRRLEPWVPGRPHQRAGRIGNHLGGLWVKVYNSSGKMVFEHKNFTSGVSAGSWRH